MIIWQVRNNSSNNCWSSGRFPGSNWIGVTVRKGTATQAMFLGCLGFCRNPATFLFLATRAAKEEDNPKAFVAGAC